MNPVLSSAMAALIGASMALGAASQAAAQGARAPVALSADPQEAGLTCFYSAVVTGGGNTEAVAEATWFLFDTARRVTTDAPDTFIVKVEELADLPPPNLESLAADAPQLLPLCASRYPLISSKRTITLPSDPLTRDMQCFALTSYMAGVAESELEDAGESPFGKRVSVLADTLSAKLTEDRLKAAGITDEAAMQNLFSRSLRDVSPLGNPMKVLEACEAVVS
ncbi:hypothetical protein [Blastomonas fulva]|uniref:hypothetical protein n=1 Tax=Blastomonas fulva TaxID=1550728 RepID=UPI003F7049D1